MKINLEKIAKEIEENFNVYTDIHESEAQYQRVFDCEECCINKSMLHVSKKNDVVCHWDNLTICEGGGILNSNKERNAEMMKWFEKNKKRFEVNNK